MEDETKSAGEPLVWTQPSILRVLRVLHGLLLMVLLLLPRLLSVFDEWPCYFLVPFLAYSLLRDLITPLRESACWMRRGNLGSAVLIETALLVVLSSTALVFYQITIRPDLDYLRAKMPVWLPTNLVLAGMFFAVMNAALEEVIFRGVFLDALDAEFGFRIAVLVQAALFGLGHARGYPPGALGVVMASGYGLLLGLLARRSQGLAAPVLAHICADATIFALVVMDGH
jgi:membrane protease YdiL (CAAX protease family)